MNRFYVRLGYDDVLHRLQIQSHDGAHTGHR